MTEETSRSSLERKWQKKSLVSNRCMRLGGSHLKEVRESEYYLSYIVVEIFRHKWLDGWSSLQARMGIKIKCTQIKHNIKELRKFYVKTLTGNHGRGNFTIILKLRKLQCVGDVYGLKLRFAFLDQDRIEARGIPKVWKKSSFLWE